MEPCQLPAAEAAALIRSKQLSCEELARSCLTRIAARDADVKASLWLDPEHAIRRARELDKPQSKGPLHGVAVRREGHYLYITPLVSDHAEFADL